MGDCNGAYPDPDGPVVVALGVPLGDVRRFLAVGRRVERPGGHAGMALFVTRSVEEADDMAACGVPAVAVVEPGGRMPAGAAIGVGAHALGEWLKAFDDGVPITAREADALAWVNAIRAEEQRTQAEGARAASEQLERVQAQLDAVEGSRAYRLSRRMVATKDRLRALVRRR